MPKVAKLKATQNVAAKTNTKEDKKSKAVAIVDDDKKQGKKRSASASPVKVRS